MADVAHDPSGPASPKPGDIAPQQASRLDSPDRGKLRVFISYSRDDLRFADQLNAALNACGFECFIDREGISGGEEWKQRLGNLIRDADTVVFVLSPTSARSEICAWEVEEAARLGKRILPVNCQPLKGVSPPPRLRDLNYIFFYEDPKVKDSGFGTGLLSLVEALNTDFDWLREHTRYLQRATEWDSRGRPPNRLLSGDDIAEAKTWVARRPKNAPEPTTLHLDFIRASEEEGQARSSAQRKQLEEMAAAQAERERALHEAEEALKQAVDAQRKRARIRNIAFVVVSFFAVLAGWLYLNAEQQRQQADEILTGATGIIANLLSDLFPHLDADTKKQIFTVLQSGAHHGDVTSMRNLGILYMYGTGAERDYAKSREWSAKAADKGDTTAMLELGVLYEYGRGVAKDYAKAREWYEKAASKGHWVAEAQLEQLPVSEATSAGHYAEALQLAEALAAKKEAAETKREGNPGRETAQALGGVAWRALFTLEFTKALTFADRAHALLPDDLRIETVRAHALMFLERREESKGALPCPQGRAVLFGAGSWAMGARHRRGLRRLPQGGLDAPDDGRDREGVGPLPLIGGASRMNVGLDRRARIVRRSRVHAAMGPPKANVRRA
jgi:TPR repeat protein